MEIKNLVGELNPYAKKKVQGNSNATAASKGAKSSGDHNDVVKVSPEARLRGAAHVEASKASDIRAEKVKELKEKVRSGTYNPDIKKAAANLIRDDLNMLI